ncbi:MAG: response regulator transcription factor [Planctomycetaceae bacterium]|nr:response regulator transcription factor [Planctomycetaceae bacterium]
MDKNKTNKSTHKWTVLLVDDHPVVRQGLRTLIDGENDIAVCAEADSPSEALRLIEKHQPEGAVIDLTLQEGSGLELIKDIRIRYPRMLLLVWSMRDEFFYAERVLRAGARGYVIKTEPGDKVVEGLRRIRQGQIYLSDRMTSRMINRLASNRVAPGQPSVQDLTDREMEVFELIGSGLPTREIAERLHLSVKTIDSHREHIKDKLQLDNATELLKHAIRWVQSGAYG